MYSKIYRLPAVSLYCQERASFVEFPLAPPCCPCSPSGLGTCTPAIHSIYNRAASRERPANLFILHAICSVSVQLKYIFFICKIVGHDTSERENVRKIRIEVSRSLTRQLKPLNFSEFLESDHFTESKKKIFCITE